MDVGPTLYFFHMPGCEACAEAEPALDEWASANPFAMVTRARADGLLAQRMQLRLKATPTYVLRQGEEMIQHVGAMTAKQLDRWVRVAVGAE